MKFTQKKLILGVFFVFFMALSTILVTNQLPLTPQTIKTSDETELTPLEWTDYSCSDFQDEDDKIYEQMTNFSFIVGSTTLTYGLYLGAGFFETDSENTTLVIYAFLVTLTDQFVQSQSTTFTFWLNMTYRSISAEENGTVSANAPYISFSSCLCDYPLFHMNFSKEAESSILSLNISYTSHSAQFDETGIYNTSASLATMEKTFRPIPILPCFVVLGLILVMLINLIVKRRNLT